jgi:alkylation response protein AidB-like acyl-CoA dehydrogenase
MNQNAHRIEWLLPSPVAQLQQVIDDDEADRFPAEVDSLLNNIGIMQEMIPQSVGGRLGSIEELLGINRVLSRRNLTAAIAIGQSLLGALPVWIAGNDSQKRRMAELLGEAGLSCLALTEKDHGSDLQANAVSLSDADEQHCTLNGEKWCINNATRGASMCLLARSHPEGGEQGFSVVFVDKSIIDAARYDKLPRLKTHGIRGADISGIHFRQCRIPRTAIVGRVGAGLTITLRTLQISRTLCAGFSLGAMDTCLRLATRFAAGRVLYGAPVTQIGSVDTQLGRLYRELLLCEAVSVTMARSCTITPELMSVYSAIVKYHVPVTADALIHQCGVILGARGYLREGEFALFQKMKRDHAVVSLFDGSTEVNLYVICGQLRHLLNEKPLSGEDQTSLSRLFDLSQTAPAFEGQGLKLSNRGKDLIAAGVASLADNAGIDADVREMALQLRNDYRQLACDFGALPEDSGQMSAAVFDMAKRYCHLSARAIYLQFWLANRSRFHEPLMQTSMWLKTMLTIDAAHPSAAPLLAQVHGNQLLSHTAFSVQT